MPPVVIERRVDCKAPPAAIWKLLADTERLNREVGLPPVAATPHSGGAARYTIQTRVSGFALVYEELPFEWVEHEWFRVRRVVRAGVVSEMTNEFRLKRRKGGTRVRVLLSAQARWGVLAPVVRLELQRIAARMGAAIRRFDEELGTGTPPLAHPQGDQLALRRVVDDLRGRLAAEARPVGERLVAHVLTAPDAELDRIRPFELAARWDVERRAVLATCLHAVTCGVLELSWDLVCPSCRTATDRFSGLGALPEAGHCQLCDLRYDLDLDRAVEAVFRPAPAIRVVDAGPYCIGGPARFPHVLAQSLVLPDGHAAFTLPDDEGTCRVFVRGGATATVRVVEGGAGDARLVLSEAGLEPSALDVGPSARLVVEQQGGEPRHLKLERNVWARDAATAFEVSALPEFRRLFSADVLAPGTALRVSRVALLFSDLVGSTAMYAAVGDARAYRFVQRHFTLLGTIIARHGGALTKTIGDAVMAAFADDEAAVRAALDMLAAFPALRDEESATRGVDLKVGVFAGPCFAVTANGLLDYFGQTVNTAARLQGTARAAELVVERELAHRVAAQGGLGAFTLSDAFAAELKGIDAAVEVVRISAVE